MSVIIRLQNLPWTANASDIRHFFHGLSIPEGGVHIVGGPLGDAFIAFSTDEDARQGMASNGGMLKDARVKLYLSSRAEMQKIIEETRQQHLVLRASVSGEPDAMASAHPLIQRPLTNSTTKFPSLTIANTEQPKSSSTFASVGHSAPCNQAASFYPQTSLHSSNQPPLTRSEINHQHQPHQECPPSQNLKLPASRPSPMPVHVSEFSHYVSPSGEDDKKELYQHSLNPRGTGKSLRPEKESTEEGLEACSAGGSELTASYPYRSSSAMGSARVNHGHAGDASDLNRHREMDRSVHRNRDRWWRERGRERERNHLETVRRGRSRSRSSSGDRSTCRDGRRRRSPSDSRERWKDSRGRERERNGNQQLSGYHMKPKLTTAPIHQTDNSLDSQQQQYSTDVGSSVESETSVQLRLLFGDLTYRDIRDYLHGIHIPNTCIKMINAFDGYRFGLAYIRFTSRADKAQALGRHNGVIRGYPVQIFHVDDINFNQAIDSFSPGINIDAQTLAHSCLALRDFPPMGTANAIDQAFGSISIGRVLPERNESGTVTGLCYVELAGENDARRAVQLLKDGVAICGHPVRIAFLPLNELITCENNLERLRKLGITNSMPAKRDGSSDPRQSTAHQDLAVRSISSGEVTPSLADSRGKSPYHFDGSDAYNLSTDRHSFRPATIQRIRISGLPLNVMERDVGDFFSDVGIIPQAIEIAVGDDLLPNGTAYASFGTVHEAKRALDKDGGFFGGATVRVSLVATPIPIVDHVANASSLYTDHGSRDLSHVETPSRMYGANLPGEETSTQIDQHFDGPRFPGHGFRDSRPHIGQRSRAPIGHHSMIHRGSKEFNNFVASSKPGFGAPGCVVALTNIDHDATVTDILDFFRDFHLNEKSIIRRFNNGVPTGEARVFFSTSEDAELAVRSLSNKYLLSRRIVLSVV